MKKLFNWCKEHILFLFSLFLLAFIPLYPKLPLIDVKHVWVYVRIEDFIVLFSLLCLVVLVVRRKLALQTPITVPILIFWIIGTVATIHGVLLVFPELSNVFPNVAFLSLLRRIEYMSLFFISYAGMKDKRLFSYFNATVVLTLFGVLVYAVGQRYFSLPAYLTMNEEFAKGIPLQLSSLSRVSSTFAGHYDLAAYLVLVIPITVSLIFGYRNWFVKAILLAIASLGLFVLFMTVSRISFLALFVSLGLVLLMQKKKIVIFSVPIIVVAAVLFLTFSPSLLDRFGSTIKQITLLVDMRTGVPIGQVKETPKSYFKNKQVKQEYFTSIATVTTSSPSASLLIPYEYLPEQVLMLVKPLEPTGEDLPQGTGYINLSLSPVIKRLGSFLYERKPDPKTGEIVVTTINGDYLLKKASAYDLSFTTRFQGEWPRALAAFKRNIFLGSGYGSVSLAVDNSYLRMFGEVGLLGFVSFLAIFLIIGAYIRKVLPVIDSGPIKGFIIGLSAGIIGLAINGLFIDVFEASKIAFVLWLFIGAALAILRMYDQGSFDSIAELKKIATSTYAITLYLLIITVLLFSQMTGNYFVGDDFTWFRWAADCGKNVMSSGQCPQSISTILNYFTHADGFFYRPGTKMYFMFMYKAFWLNQTMYHTVSFFLHFVVSVLVFLLAKKIFKSVLLATVTGVLFLLLSGFSEAVFWISATGFLFTACFSLGSLLMFISWLDSKKTLHFVLTLLLFIFSLLFHEVGIVTPLLYLLYQHTFTMPSGIRSLWKDIHYRLFFLPIPIYLIIRFFAQSHWFNGDYSYNLFKLPLNVVGNAMGYTALTLVGPFALPFYGTLRGFLRDHMLVSAGITVVVILLSIVVWKLIAKNIKKTEISILKFGAFFSIITLLPFLGLGNISSRYSYLSSIGILLVFVYFLKKFYMYAGSSGLTIARASVVLAVGIFALWHIIELQQIHGDWHEAGVMTQRFLVSIDSVYSDAFARESMELHFVHVPIRHGEAWVFPVGLPDVLWLVFRNPRLSVYIWPSLDQAYAAVRKNLPNQKIFVFDDSGNVTEVEKPPSAP